MDADFGHVSGATFTPAVAANGDISWTNDGGLDNPATVNIMGPPGAKGDKGDPGQDATIPPATAAPLMDGAASVGTSAKYAREDHRHPVDTSRAAAADVSKILAYLKNMEVYRTASGNPATFSDAKAANLKALRVTITPTQSGSGDPSPSNVRPIIGVSSVTVTRTGENGANPQSVTVALSDGANPLTVYGGTLDVTAGELTVTHAFAEYDGDENWITQTNAKSKILLTLRAAMQGATENADNVIGEAFLASAYAQNNASYLWNYNGADAIFSHAYYSGAGYKHVISFYDPRFADQSAEDALSQFRAYLVQSPLQIAYPLAAPVAYQLAPAQLAALAGYNAVSGNAGTLSVTYLSDPEIALGGGV